MKHLSKFILYCFLTVLFFTQPAWAQKSEKSRNIKKEYSNAKKLIIRNKHGKVHVNTHSSNQLKVDIKIMAKAKSAEKAEEVLNSIGVNISEKAGVITLQTFVKSPSKGWGNSRSFKINYTIDMPKKLALDLQNKYGSTYLADHSGSLVLTSNHGALKAENLSGSGSKVTINHGSASITSLNNGNLKVAYSSANLEKGGNINLSLKHGNLNSGQINQVNGQASHSSLNVIKINQGLDLVLEFMQGINVKEIASNFKKINIKSSYSSINLKFIKPTKYNFTADMSHSSLSLSEGTKYNKNQKSYTHNYYEGTHNGGGNATVNITSRYGSVKLK